MTKLPPIVSAEKVNVLLVDHQPARLSSYDAMLSVLGQNLVHARSSEDALQRLKAADFAAIVISVDMPQMGGFELAATLRQDPRVETTPIILVTAVHITDLERLKGRTLGAIDYVYVPVVPEILRGKVQVLVELYRHRRELELLHQRLARTNADLAATVATLQAQQTRELEALNASLAAANQDLEQTNLTLQAEIAQHNLAQAALAEADRRKDDFLAMLSHELRNPLSAMQGAIELMQRITLDDPQLAWSRSVLARQHRHLIRLIDELLDVSRITRGNLALKTSAIDLREVIEHALETVRPMILGRKHGLLVELPQEPLRVLGDPVRLTQVVSNLLSNAAKYTAAGGHIVLTLTSKESGDGAHALIQVEDDGCGIDASLIERLFEPSTHADRVRRGAQDGLGIGLIVVRRLVEMHGGRVDVYSEGTGRGSRFTVSLPLLAAATNIAPAADQPCADEVPAPMPLESLKILVVDDNEDSAESMSMLLQCEGHVIDTAYSGESALRLAGELQPDVVLLDIGMPGMMGYEVAQRLRSLDGLANALLIAVTGYGRETDIAQARTAGFDHHLVKPVDYNKLRALLATRQAGAPPPG